MLKKLGIATLALMLSSGAFSIADAASDASDNFYCRDGYYCNRNYNQSDRQNDAYCGEYGCGGYQRGCWR